MLFAKLFTSPRKRAERLARQEKRLRDSSDLEKPVKDQAKRSKRRMRRAKSLRTAGELKKARNVIPGGLCTRNHPLYYVSLAKSGCTSVKNILYFLDTGQWYHDPLAIHGDKEALLRNQGSDRDALIHAFQNRKVTFTFVREPFARAYSSFNQKIFQKGQHTFPTIRKLLIKNYGAVFPAKGQDYSAVDHGHNFLCFLRMALDTVELKTHKKLNPHWIPQKLALGRYRRSVNIDFVGRIENFAEDMKTVLDRAKIDVAVDFNVRFNESARPPFTLDEIMTDEIHEALLKTYGMDLEYFGYKDRYSR